MDWESLREEFPITRNFNFQDHAAVAPMCRRSTEAAVAFLRESEQYGYLRGSGYKHADVVRQGAATLINANPDEVTFVKNTSEGLSLVAAGLSWNHGDNVVLANVEFPSNVYPWMALQPRGVKLNLVLEEDGRLPLDRVFEAINPRTRLVAISSVQYAGGFRTDLASLGEFCQKKGVLLCVDAIQSLGALPIDVKAMNIDFLSADGHKWLCGPEGCGIFYVRKELQGHLRPTSVGWLSVKHPTDFTHPRLEFHDNIKRYDSGAYNLCGIHALGAAIDLWLGLGMEHVTARIMALTNRLVAGVRDKGYRVFSSRRPAESSGIVAFFSDVHDHQKIQRHLLAEHRVVISVRSDRLRASPHVYNTEREIDSLIDLLPRH